MRLFKQNSAASHLDTAISYKRILKKLCSHTVPKRHDNECESTLPKYYAVSI